MTIKLDHINISVANLSLSIDFYKNIFGFELVESGQSPSGIKWAIVAFDDSMICMSELSNRKASSPSENEATHQIYHFGIRISDLEEWRRRIREYDLKLQYGGEIDYPFSKSWYFSDPSGHTIEVSYSANDKLKFA